MGSAAQRAELAIILVFPIIAGISVGLRLWGRRISRYTYGWDDYLIVVAMVAVIAHCITSYNHVKTNYLGIPFDEVPKDADQGLARRWAFANMLCYTPVLPLVKASMLMFLARLEPGSKHIMRYLWAVFFINAGVLISAEVTIIFQCNPISTAYTPFDPTKKFTCINLGAFFMWGTCITIVTDFLVLSIPIMITHNLQLQTRRKVAVTILLCLGALVTVFSIWRLVQFIQMLYLNSDPTRPTSDFGFSASTLETNIGVICACGPGIKPVLKRYCPSLLGASSRGTETGNQYSRSKMGYGGNSRPHHLNSHVDGGMFEMSSKTHHHVNIGASGKRNVKRGSLSESDEEQIMGKQAIVKTLDISVKYQEDVNNNSTTNSRAREHDGKAASVDSLV
ncbi:hypothetical protein FQN57_002307 [Myotisia sp. PD_48]|nr:hypothetical protein FQN57_002307 [Myotisia sp. PD_48]